MTSDLCGLGNIEMTPTEAVPRLRGEKTFDSVKMIVNVRA
jgi:hypothetical protein